MTDEMDKRQWNDWGKAIDLVISLDPDTIPTVAASESHRALMRELYRQLSRARDQLQQHRELRELLQQYTTCLTGWRHVSKSFPGQQEAQMVVLENKVLTPQ